MLSYEFSVPSDDSESQKNTEAPKAISAELEQLSESDAEALLLKELENINYSERT